LWCGGRGRSVGRQCGGDRCITIIPYILLVKPLRSYIAAILRHGVEIVLEVGGVVIGQKHGLEGGEVCQHHPVRRGAEHVLGLNISVHNPQLMAYLEALEELE
jgi:hypothetical protein